jgi:hypothetical protein
MAVVLKLRCPDCVETFKWPGDQKWPEFCPMCRAQLSTGTDEVAMPFIRSANMKKTDNVYRDMERGSEVRAQMASDMLGVPMSELSDMKITNLRDDKDQSRAPHIMVKNEVSKLMDNAPDATGFQAMGAQLSSGTQMGPFANAGAKFQTKIREFHAGKAGFSAMSDNPSNEVMNPNYRRRA